MNWLIVAGVAFVALVGWRLRARKVHRVRWSRPRIYEKGPVWPKIVWGHDNPKCHYDVVTIAMRDNEAVICIENRKEPVSLIQKHSFEDSVDIIRERIAGEPPLYFKEIYEAVKTRESRAQQGEYEKVVKEILVEWRLLCG